jgi:hypothetical protein
MITCNVPEGGPTSIEGLRGNNDKEMPIYVARFYNGRNVIDLPALIFVQQLQGGMGLDWQRLNSKAIEFIAAHQDGYYGTPFPDEDFTPPPKAKPPAAPVMVRLMAPEGVTHFSHAGEEHKVAEGGFITVTDEVAATLRSHGFRDAA